MPGRIWQAFALVREEDLLESLDSFKAVVVLRENARAKAVCSIAKVANPFKALKTAAPRRSRRLQESRKSGESNLYQKILDMLQKDNSKTFELVLPIQDADVGVSNTSETHCESQNMEHINLDGLPIDAFIVRGPGPWSLSKYPPHIELGVDGLCYCIPEPSPREEKLRQELMAYGCAQQTDSLPALELGLRKLYEISQTHEEGKIKHREMLSESSGCKLAHFVGCRMIAAASLEVPKLLRKLLAFVRMTKVPADAPKLYFHQVSATFSLIEQRGYQLCLIADNEKPFAQRMQAGFCWLLDLFLGTLVGASLTFYQSEIGDMLYDSVGYLFQSRNMRSRVLWVLSQHAPLGFKLNKGLDEVLGNTVLLVIEAWHIFTAGVAPYSPQILFIIGVLSICGGGFSMILAAACDAAAFVTLHIQFLYNFFARVHLFQLAGMSSFWKVIRGKKYNVLRKRVDTGNYDTGQLLFGSMAFIIFGFLFQTTLAYYIMFTSLWVVTVSFHAILLSILRMVQCFPIYSIFMLVQRPTLLPCSIELQVSVAPWGGETFILCGGYTRPLEVFKTWAGLLHSFVQWGRRSAKLGIVGSIMQGEQIPLSSVDFPRCEQELIHLKVSQGQGE